LKALDDAHNGCLDIEQDNPHVAGHVVDKEEEVASASRCSRCHGATEITVYELQLLLGMEARPTREGEPPQLGEDAGVAELLHVIDVRHAPHHLLAAELPQGLKVEVPKALLQASLSRRATRQQGCATCA
jgi:hypothetical protein